MQEHELSKFSYRFAIAVYAIIAAFGFYVFYNFWIFLGYHALPQTVTSVFSVKNANFYAVNRILSGIFAVTVLLCLAFYRKLREYILDVGEELHRVAWPTFQEAQKTTGLVLIMIVCVGIFLFFADSAILKIMNLIMGTAS